MDDELVEKVRDAIFNAENGIDGDQIGDMLHEDFRIPSKNSIEATKMVCERAARAAPPALPPFARLGALPLTSSASPVAMRPIKTAAPITSAGRFSPRGPLGMGTPLPDHTMDHWPLRTGSTDLDFIPIETETLPKFAGTRFTFPLICGSGRETRMMQKPCIRLKR